MEKWEEHKRAQGINTPRGFPLLVLDHPGLDEWGHPPAVHPFVPGLPTYAGGTFNGGMGPGWPGGAGPVPPGGMVGFQGGGWDEDDGADMFFFVGIEVYWRARGRGN